MDKTNVTDQNKWSSKKKIIAAIIGVIVIGLVVWLAYPRIGGHQASKSSTETVQKMKAPLDVRAKLVEIIAYQKATRKQVNAWEDTVIQLRAEIDALKKDCCKKSSPKQTTIKKETPVVKEPVVKETVTNPVEQNIKPLPEGKPSMADLDYLGQGGKFEFCIVINGNPKINFPQYALDQKVEFTSVVENPGGDGHNFVVQQVSGLEGDYGIYWDASTKRAFFFVKLEKIKTVLSMPPSAASGVTPEELVLKSIYFKGYYSKWQMIPMTIGTEYAILETTNSNSGQ